MQPYLGNVLPGLLAAADPTRPVLTYYDDASGERTELSGATVDNWVAKTANLLVDGCGLGTGDRAAVWLPPHWQTAVILFGCWSAGLTVTGPGAGTEPAGGVRVDVVFAAADRVTGAPDAPDRYALGLAPMAMPLAVVPDGWSDYVVEVRGHGDRFGGYPRPADPATPDATHDELCARARRRAEALGLANGDRVLVDAGTHTDPLEWLLAPLAAGASVVLCGHLDPVRLADRRAAERITRELGTEPAPGDR